MESKKFSDVKSQQILLNLDDVLDMLYEDHTYGRCFNCKNKHQSSNLVLRISCQVWSIVCKNCIRRNYFNP